MTVHVLVWDAAAWWVVEQLRAAGRLPALSTLATRGVLMPLDPPSPNCQTPAALATLFTGHDPRDHGITGYDVPDVERGGVLAHRSGLDRAALRVPPVWETLDAAGHTCSLLHLPWTFDHQGGAVTGDRTYTSAGYPGERTPPGIIPIAADGACSPVHLADVEWEMRRHGERVHLDDPQGAQASAGFDLQSERWTRFGPEPTGTYVRAARHPDTDAPMLLHTGWSVRWRHAGTSVTHLEPAEPGPFAGRTLRKSYRAGALGTRAVDGGSGGAEALFGSSCSVVAQSFCTELASLLALDDRPDLLVSYLPVIDDVQHEAVGWIDAQSRAHRPAVHEPIWKLIGDVYELADELLACTLEATRPDDTVFVVSDHGMAGTTTSVAINHVLASSGLVAVGDRGEIDIARSHVVYSPANNGSLWINRADRPGGFVEPEDVGRVADEAVASLLAAHDPGSGAPVVRTVLDARSGLDPTLGDLFVVMADDCQPTPAVAGDLCSASGKSGSHVTRTRSLTERQRLHGIVAVVGPGSRHLVTSVGAEAQPALPAEDLAGMVLAEVAHAAAPVVAGRGT